MMDHWNNMNLLQYNNVPGQSSLNIASQESFDLSGLVRNQSMAGSGFSIGFSNPLPAHGTLCVNYNPLNTNMLQPSVDQLVTSLSGQQLFSNCNQKQLPTSMHDQLEHAKSNLIADHQNNHLMSPDLIPSEFNSFCKSWGTKSTLNPESILMSSSKGNLISQEPPPAHSGNRQNVSQNFKTINNSQEAASFIISSEGPQFSAKNLTISSYPSEVQKFSDSGNSDLQKLVLGQQVYIEGINNNNNMNDSKLTDVATLRITNQPFKYITMQPSGYGNSILFLDKNHFASNQEILQKQATPLTLYQNLPQAQQIPLYQYPQLPDLAGLTKSSPNATASTSNFVNVTSKINDCLVVSGSSYLNLIAGSYNQQQSLSQIDLNCVEAVQAVADSTTKPKRGTRGSGSKLINKLSDESGDKKKLKGKRFISNLKNESNIGHQGKVYQSHNNEFVGLNTNEVNFERNIAVSMPPSFCSVDSDIFAKVFESEGLVNIEQTSNSFAMNLLGSQLVNSDQTKPVSKGERESKLFLTNVFGSNFVNPDDIAESSRADKQVTVDDVRGKKDAILQMSCQLDDEFCHLVHDPLPSVGPSRMLFHPKPNRRTFADCFVDFIQGKKQETLSSLTNVPITKKPNLPKYIPDVRFSRKDTESESVSKRLSESINHNPPAISTTLSKVKIFGDQQPSLIVPNYLNSNKYESNKQETKKKKRKFQNKFKGYKEEDSMDTMDVSSYNDGYDSGSDPAWCPEKHIHKPGSSSKMKSFSKRKKITKLTDHINIKNGVSCSTTSSENKKDSSKYEKGDFLIDKKDVDKFESRSYNIWRVDSNRLLQKYEPSDDQLLHLPTSTYSSWAENMSENYLLLKVQLTSSKEKSVKVVQVVDDDHNPRLIDSLKLLVDAHERLETTEEDLPVFSTIPSTLSSDNLQDKSMNLLQKFNQIQLQSELNGYIEMLMQQCLNSSGSSNQFQVKGPAEATPIIDDLLKFCKDRLRGAVRWSVDFVLAVDQHSLMTICDSLNKELSCQVSGVRKAEKLIRLYGEKYNPESLFVVQVVDQSNAQEFYVNADIANVCRAYHEVHVLKFKMLSQCVMRVKELRKTGMLEGSMDDESWMCSVKDNFIQTLKDNCKFV